MKTNVTKPSKELEAMIMKFIFSKECEDHREALAIWDKSPWLAISMYEVEHHPEYLGLPIAFPEEAEVPQWFLRKLQDEELLAMAGEPVYINFPRAGASKIEVGDKELEVNIFGRIISDDDD